jgi:hypothetical protein
MSNYAAAGLFAVAMALGACATQTHGPGGIAYDANRGVSPDVGATSQGVPYRAAQRPRAKRNDAETRRPASIVTDTVRRQAPSSTPPVL